MRWGDAIYHCQPGERDKPAALTGLGPRFHGQLGPNTGTKWTQCAMIPKPIINNV